VDRRDGTVWGGGPFCPTEYASVRSDGRYFRTFSEPVIHKRINKPTNFAPLVAISIPSEMDATVDS